ncbi:hypothetical protein AS19_04560 [Alcanivorax sp. NBRC 101098]|jgi:uncharacterized protein with von Willebrand factor type A (vWA) domain|uniref:vWA domain-containing protein n=1 Tax=Alcanivorax TaxID=59753 RepID=UPI0004ABE313|nr:MULTISPECIES: VWA domain-containing protein [unclassified Alcanivorax]BAP13307.1 hypothetical protein AS19_04560 [Alcanivorax sp. NBRC 101098]
MPTRRLSEFVQALRGAGLRISPDEATQAMDAAALVGYQGRQRFHDALAMTLVKQEEDRSAFEETFARFFAVTSDVRSGLSSQSAPRAMPAAVNEVGETSEKGRTEEVFADLTTQTPAQLDQRLAEAAARMDFTQMEVITQQGLYTRRLLMNMGMGAVDDRILELDKGGALCLARAETLRQWRQEVREQAADHVRRQFLLHGAGKGRALREQTMRAVPFRHLREFQEVKTLVRRMARRLASLHQRRMKKSRRGMLDARRTLVAGIRHDGIPMRLHWRQRPVQKSRVMVICDVSSSVSDAARFLLQFLYAMNDVLPRVRSFAFASRFDEITEDFQRYSPDVAVGRVLDRLSGSGTDYAEMFADFWRRCERELDSHTTVIILGDARNNYLPEGAEVLQQIRRRVKQVWWLNPEARSRWNSGDAVMDRYLPHCRMARQCASLDDLERIVDSLLKGLN